MGAAEAIVLMGEPEARLLVTEINSSMGSVREKVLRLDEGEGWRALGYSSWRACAKAEFPHFSERRLYQELTAAKVEKVLNNCSKEPVRIPESQTRELAKLDTPEEQVAAWKQAVETAPEGKVTAKHVAEVVKKIAAVEAIAKRIPELEADRVWQQMTGDAPKESEPEQPRPRPEMWWTCPKCLTAFNLESAKKQGWVDRGYCPHDEEGDDECAAEELDEDEAFDPRDATYQLECAFGDVLASWPREVPLTELVDWLRVKHEMMKVEAAQWKA